MAIQIRRSEDRGHADHGWLRSQHTFSFANYYHPDHLGFRTLRVINEDRVAPGEGFGRHPHRDMEIISYVLDGALEHKDTLGNGSVITPGDVQRMSAGRGIAHSEYNHSKEEPVHFLQIWITPSETGIEPGYEQIRIEPEEKRNRLRLVASQDGRDGSVTIHQDAELYVSLLEAGQELEHRPKKDRGIWVQVARGEVQVGTEHLRAGDGAAIEDSEMLRIVGLQDAEILVFELT